MSAFLQSNLTLVIFSLVYLIIVPFRQFANSPPTTLVKKGFLLQRVNWIIHVRKGSLPKYLLILNDCGYNTMKGLMKASSLNLTLNYCNQDSAQVLFGKYHGKCCWEREGMQNTAVYYLIDKEFLKAYIYACQLTLSIYYCR